LGRKWEDTERQVRAAFGFEDFATLYDCGCTLTCLIGREKEREESRSEIRDGIEIEIPSSRLKTG